MNPETQGKLHVTMVAETGMRQLQAKECNEWQQPVAARERGIQQNLSPNFQEPTWLNTFIQTFSFQSSEGIDICDF